MDIKLISAHSPKFNADGSVTLLCKFEHLGDMEIPFTASVNDSMEHGRTIHAQALLEEFGEVMPYVAPTPEQVSLRERPMRLKKAIEQVQHYEMMNNPEAVAEWKNYYSEVYSGVVNPVEPITE